MKENIVAWNAQTDYDSYLGQPTGALNFSNIPTYQQGTNGNSVQDFDIQLFFYTPCPGLKLYILNLLSKLI